jgi:quercetin dioxygenase-like cupin family protein
MSSTTPVSYPTASPLGARVLETLTPVVFSDARGSISTFLPPEAIVEYNLVTLRAGMVRGLHWHPHFIEYILVTGGHGWLRWRDVDGGEVHEEELTPGFSSRAVPGVVHAIEADTDLTFVALLTRRWDNSDPPIVRCDV